MSKSVGDFLAELGGGDETTLQRVPRAKQRFIQSGLILLTTSSLAVASMGFALTSGLKAPVWLAIPLGLFWGAIILNLDRHLMLSMTSKGFFRQLLIAIPRLMMAAVLALVISTPLVLRVFASDIHREMTQLQLQRSEQEAGQESSTKEVQDLAKLQQQIKDQQSIIDGHLPDSVTTPQLIAAQSTLTSLQGQVASAQTAANTAYEAWQCELYGAGATCHDASAKKGSGPLSQAKQMEYQQAQSTLSGLTQQERAAEKTATSAQKSAGHDQASVLATAQAQAKATLPRLQAQYDALNNEINAVAADDTSANRNDTGLLAQLHALSELTKSDPSLADARLAVEALFFMIEILPVLVKLLAGLGSTGIYETALKENDEELGARIRSRRIEARRVEEGRARMRLNVEEDMRSHEEEMGKRVNKHVADEMTNMVDLALSRWSQEVEARLAAQAQRVVPPTPSWRDPAIPPRFVTDPVPPLSHERSLPDDGAYFGTDLGMPTEAASEVPLGPTVGHNILPIRS